MTATRATAGQLVRPAGSSASGPFAVDISPSDAGWAFCGLRILQLEPGVPQAIETDDRETLVVPLAGSAVVECDGQSLELAGRRSVFTGPTDFAYLPIDATATLRSAGGGRFALPSARASRRLPVRYGPVGGVPVELRGAGACSRQVNNFCTPETFDADVLIACEVITPGGNWSSYPPHKHDEARIVDGRAVEAELEEIYYFEVDGDAGAAYQRVYGTPERPIDVLAEVRTGDVVLIPHGWHGPSMALPGYDLYYLNVMGGPGGDRAWLICDDPAHAWIRDTWAGQPVDPRLPVGSDRAGAGAGAGGEDT
jgi:5-deoxy-glucuronate isomerase